MGTPGPQSGWRQFAGRDSTTKIYCVICISFSSALRAWSSHRAAPACLLEHTANCDDSLRSRPRFRWGRRISSMSSLGRRFVNKRRRPLYFHRDDFASAIAFPYESSFIQTSSILQTPFDISPFNSASNVRDFRVEKNYRNEISISTKTQQQTFAA